MSSVVSRREWAWALVAAVLILALTSLPVWAGYTAQKPGWEFGGAVYDRADYSVHLAAMRLGWEGADRYRLLFTTESHPGAYVKLAYVALGHAARLFGISLPSAYQAARGLAGLALLLLLYRFIAQATSSISLRRMGYAMAAAGSGLAWLQGPTGWVPNAQISPMDLWLIDAYVFFSVMTFPHFAALAALVLGGVLSMDRFAHSSSLGAWMVVAICSQAILLIQPFGVAILDAGLAGVLVTYWRRGKRKRPLVIGLAGLLLLQLPLLAYNAWVFRSHPVWSGFASQNITLSPPPLYLLFGFGILLPLAIAGAWIAWRRRHTWGILCAVWLGLTLVMAYLPTGLQRRFLGYWTVPLAVLAIVGVERGLIRWVRPLLGSDPAKRRRRRGTVVLALAASSLPTSLYLSAGGALYARFAPPDLFDPEPLLAAVEWLDGQAGAGEAVFAAPRSGLLIPYRTGSAVYVGHPMETVDYLDKREQAEAFYDSAAMQAAERRSLLAGCGCRWLLDGPFEAELGGYPEGGAAWLSLLDEYAEGEAAWLTLRYEIGGVRVWRVDAEGGGQ